MAEIGLKVRRKEPMVYVLWLGVGGVRPVVDGGGIVTNRRRGDETLVESSPGAGERTVWSMSILYHRRPLSFALLFQSQFYQNLRKIEVEGAPPSYRTLHALTRTIPARSASATPNVAAPPVAAVAADHAAHLCGDARTTMATVRRDTRQETTA